ncbi:hypothetical protein OG590_39500 (plasmid) [Streptomyces goshikiensis]|uniref:hypothetical protein n=1 Tax=Streptomyces goshikiensis TaxID=1942 RepID=UPI002F90D276|nr:hypothetical protein OG590_39500 [Streptomyces goshikiensis]
MAWIYAELTKEAGKRGGPEALRYFYRGQGVLIGAALTGASIAGTVAYEKWRARRAAEPAPQPTEMPTPSGSIPQH